MTRAHPSVNLSAGSVPVEDVDEEIFALVTRKLQYSSAPAITAQDEERPSEGGLGFHSSKDEVLPLSLTVRNPWAHANGADAVERKTKKGVKALGGREGEKARQDITVEVEVHQSLGDLRNRKGDTGSVLWRISLHLARYLLQQHHFPHPSHPPLLPSLPSSTILELGSGTGFLGMALREIYSATTNEGRGGRWIFSDQLANLPLVVRNLRANGLMEPPNSPTPRTTSLSPQREFSANSPSSRPLGPRTAKVGRAPVEVLELDWIVEAAAWDRHPHSLYSSSSPCHPPLPSPPSIILASDCIYNPFLSAPLAKTILRHAGPATVVLVASEIRDEEPLEEFLKAWMREGGDGWRIWRIGCEGDESGRLGELGGGGFVVWVGWREKREVEREEE
ncbi:Ribosomal protein lysine methyltransferase [Rhodotorula toruloides]